MNQGDFDKIITRFFYTDEVQGFYSMRSAIKKEINLQSILNELVNHGLIERTPSGNYRRTQKLIDFIDETGLAYMEAPYSYYLSTLQPEKKINYDRRNYVVAIIGILLSLVLGLLAIAYSR